MQIPKLHLMLKKSLKQIVEYIYIYIYIEQDGNVRNPSQNFISRMLVIFRFLRLVHTRQNGGGALGT